MDVYIEETNASQDSYKLAHNKFSDRTREEMKLMYGDIDIDETKEAGVLETASTFNPIDWISAGAVNPIQDQGQCGSCWAFSCIASMEGAVFVDHGNLYKFSEQQLVDCSTANHGCNGGNANKGFEYFEDKNEMSEAEYPYKARNQTCKYNSSSGYTYHTRAENAYFLVQYDNLDQMYAALAKKPLTVRIQADTYAFQSYSSGIFNNPACGNQHDHATNVVGYGVSGSTAYWVMRNSWGTGWGEEGYMRLEVMQTGDGYCGIQMWPSYPLLD